MAQAKTRQPARGRSCWHVVGWAELYEPPQDRRRGRKSPLAYCKLLTGCGDVGPFEAAQILMQLRALQAAPEGLLHEGVWFRLLRLAGSRAEHRGYLVNFANKPASPTDLAVQIGVDTEQIRKSLHILEQLGFLERMTWPPVKGSPATPPRSPQRKTGGARGTGKDRKRTGRAPGKRPSKVPGKASSGQRGRARPAKSGASSANDAHLSTVEAHLPTSALQLTADDAQRQRQGQREPFLSERTGTGTETPDASAASGNGSLRSQRKTATAPNAPTAHGAQQPTRPTRSPTAGAAGAGAAEPTKADPRAGASQAPACAGQQATSTGERLAISASAVPGPGSDSPTRRSPEDAVQADRTPRSHSGAGPPGLAIVASPESFAALIFHALYGGSAGQVGAARHLGLTVEEFQARELGCFSAAWAAVLSLDLDSAGLVALYSRATKETEKIVRKRTKPKKSRGAIFMHWMNLHMDHLVGTTAWRRVKRRVEVERAIA